MMLKRRYQSILLMLVLVMPFVSCKDDSTGGNEMKPSLEVKGQGTMNGNQVVIPSVYTEDGGWVVIHRDKNGGPMVPDIIGKVQVEAGTQEDVALQLDESVADGETLWAMVHNDTGTKGEYEFTGSDSPDQPVTVDGNVLTKSFTISQTDPEVTAENQVNKGGVFVASVDAAEDGWIVIHRSNEAGDGPMVPDIIAKAQVSAGSHDSLFIPLNDGETVETGEKIWPMLHYDTGTKGEYEFDGQNGLDLPVMFDGNIVLTSFTAEADQSKLTAEDQTVADNSITVNVEADAAGWVVVHRDNGGKPDVPPIIGKAQIHEGMNQDVKISFGDSVVSDGETVWPMVHYDTGTKGEYEFTGSDSPDQPVIVDGSILTSSIVLSGATPKITANDQDGGSEVSIGEIDASQIGFIVLHRDNGNGGPTVPESIGHAQVYAGLNSDVTVKLDDGETLKSGDKVWAMLHIDNGTLGSYDFDGSSGSDDPPVTDMLDSIVMVSFTIQ